MSNLLARWLQTHTTLQAQEVGKVCEKWNNEVAFKKYLASYLRMQPETFSRLLKNIDFSQV